MYSIGIDAGGTKISAGLLKNGIIQKKIKIPTEQEKGKQRIVTNLLNVISSVSEGIDKKDIEKIGIGLPGPIDHEKGILKVAPNIKCLKDFPVKDILEVASGIPVVVENDAKCAALAESVYFNCKNLLCFTLGTGLGGGIIIDGKIYHGVDYAGELGHMVIDYKGHKCSCGNTGCLEEYCSGRGIERLSKKYFGKKIKPLELQRMAEKGDKKAIKLHEEFGTYLGIGFASYVNIFNPEMIVIGGGVGRAWKLFLPSAIKEMKKRGFRVMTQNIKVVPSELEVDEAGVIGASML
ncbi:MAG: ROK family protein [archaeon]